MAGMDEILDENELCEDIKDFGELDFIHLLWGKKDGVAKGRYYGTLDTLLANLVKAEFLLLSKEADIEIEEEP